MLTNTIIDICSTRLTTALRPLPLPRHDHCATEYNKEAARKWYTGQVFYSVKDMPLQGSTAIRGIAELDKALDYLYSNINSVPIYLYLYGG